MSHIYLLSVKYAAGFSGSLQQSLDKGDVSSAQLLLLSSFHSRLFLTQPLAPILPRLSLL